MDNDEILAALDAVGNDLDRYEEEERYYRYCHTNKHYCNSICNPNELSFWYPKAVESGFRTPETKIIYMPPDLFGDLLIDCEGEQPELEKRIRDFIVANWDVTPGELDIDSKLFFRLGGSSGKFMFRDNCIVNGPDTFANAIRNTVYENLCLDKPYSCTFVFREFIETADERPEIYRGLKLNTEFRIFYDFDKKMFLDGFNYWGDHDRMLMGMPEKQQKEYEKAYPMLEEEYKRLLPALRNECEEKLSRVNLKGRWSVDFMWTGTEFVLIDMAEMAKSCFAEKVRIPGEE